MRAPNPGFRRSVSRRETWSSGARRNSRLSTPLRISVARGRRAAGTERIPEGTPGGNRPQRGGLGRANGAEKCGDARAVRRACRGCAEGRSPIRHATTWRRRTGATVSTRRAPPRAGRGRGRSRRGVPPWSRRLTGMTARGNFSGLVSSTYRHAGRPPPRRCRPGTGIAGVPHGVGYALSDDG